MAWTVDGSSATFDGGDLFTIAVGLGPTGLSIVTYYTEKAQEMTGDTNCHDTAIPFEVLNELQSNFEAAQAAPDQEDPWNGPLF